MVLTYVMTWRDLVSLSQKKKMETDIFLYTRIPKGNYITNKDMRAWKKKKWCARGKVELDLYLMIPEKLNALLEQTEGHCSVENTFSKFVSQATDSRCVFSLFTLNRTAPS